jgi:hypothetical protein
MAAGFCARAGRVKGARSARGAAPEVPHKGRGEKGHGNTYAKRICVLAACAAGCDELILFLCNPDLTQVSLIAEAAQL